jgi:hypothetical protein
VSATTDPMADDPTSDDLSFAIPALDTISIRAVIVFDGEDPSEALAEAGIFEPVEIPIVIGDASELPPGSFGDAVGGNIEALLELGISDERRGTGKG